MKPALLLALALALCAAAPVASAQASRPADVARLRQFLDKDGGYRDREGGYYDMKAGVYRDASGGTVDNYAGYTYPNGSYKSKSGDFYDAPKKTFRLTTGENLTEPDVTAAEAIRLMRETVQEHGGYDKDLIVRSMMDAIRKEHPVK